MTKMESLDALVVIFMNTWQKIAKINKKRKGDQE